MRVNKNFTKTLAQTANILNVLNGGMTMANVYFNRKKDHYLYQIEIPSVDPEQFSVEIDLSNLFIYQKMHFDSELEIPYMIRRLNIPAEVNYKQISAEYGDGRLSIILPFNELAGGYHRDIEIQKN